MCEDNNSKVISKDVDPNKIKLKDERFNDRLFLLGTEGAASLQDGRKPGGVVNGSVKIVKKAETSLMYMSDSRPRSKCQGPMSSPRVERSKGMLHVAYVCWNSRESPGSGDMFKTLFRLNFHQSSCVSTTSKCNATKKNNQDGYYLFSIL